MDHSNPDSKESEHPSSTEKQNSSGCGDGTPEPDLTAATQASLDRFMQLFVGSGRSHGVQTHKGGRISHHTAEGPATKSDYADHLGGRVGLGVVPIREDGTCLFGTGDIDDDTINHQQLHAKVKNLQMPLVVCRSKSGGAHSYLFMKEPGIKASKVIAVLKRWVGILGYPQAEIFPKQSILTKGNRGNFINLPYFGGDQTTRYALGDDGALSLDQFLTSVIYWDGEDRVVASSEVGMAQETQMPPCLAALTKDGLAEGQRNNGLLNFAIFFRKSSPNGWEDKVVQHNQNVVMPPLPNAEVQSIIKSASRTRYQYLCNQEPICSRCNRAKCLTLPFGVGHTPWKEAGAFDDFQATHLRKFLTDPPTYLLEVNGHDIALSDDEFFSFRKLKKTVEAKLDLIIGDIKQAQWDQMRRELHQSQEEIEAPSDASDEGMILGHVMDFLGKFRLTEDKEDLLQGSPVKHGDDVWFRVLDLQRFLHLHRRVVLKNNLLYQLIRQHGGTHGTANIKGKYVHVWKFPVDKLNLQTEEFTRVSFERSPDEM